MLYSEDIFVIIYMVKKLFSFIIIIFFITSVNAEEIIMKCKFKNYKQSISQGKKLVEKAAYPNDVIFLNAVISSYYIKIKKFKCASILLKKSLQLSEKYKLGKID